MQISPAFAPKGPIDNTPALEIAKLFQWWKETTTTYTD